ncbi:MAG: TerB N-terminal domain-containing protein [Bacteroidota bacterium]
MTEQLIVKHKSFLNDNEILIPEERLKLLYFSDEPPQNDGYRIGLTLAIVPTIDDEPYSENLLKEKYEKCEKEGLVYNEILANLKKRIGIKILTGKYEPSEPSLIYIQLPIYKPRDAKSIPLPDYYPCYAKLSPAQKWVYLNWLTDITQPIPKGYVFIYYYGLERQLFGDNQVEAVKELLLLLNHHDLHRNICFMAIFYSWLNKPNEEVIKLLLTEKAKYPIDNLGLLLRYNSKKPLFPKDIFEVISQIPYLNRRYLNSQPSIYLDQLENYLNKNFSVSHFNFYEKYSIQDLPLEDVHVFYNYSFPDEYQKMGIYNFFGSSKFIAGMKNIHLEVHEMVKSYLRQNRKKSK